MPQSESTLSPVPNGEKVVDGSGAITQPWALFFQKLLQRVGGGSTTPLDQTNGSVDALTATVTGISAKVAAMGTTVSALQAQGNATAATLANLQAGLNVAEGDWVPVMTGATGNYAATGHWKSVGDELFFEVSLDASAGSVTLTAASCPLPVQPSAPSAFAVVDVTSYKDFGNGAVTSAGMLLWPNLTVNAGVVVASGRYRR